MEKWFETIGLEERDWSLTSELEVSLYSLTHLFLPPLSFSLSQISSPLFLSQVSSFVRKEEEIRQKKEKKEQGEENWEGEDWKSRTSSSYKYQTEF